MAIIKKEQFFDRKNITIQARTFVDSLKWSKQPSLDKLDFDSAALAVLDMQAYFLENDSHAFIPSADAIIPNIKQLQDLFLKKNNLVIQTRHLNTPDDAGMMNEWWGHLMTRDNPQTKILTELQDSRARVLEKNQYDAFYQTGLLDILLEKKIKHLFMTGVMTHLCVETTARSAFVRGFGVFLVVDGTATYNRDFFQCSLMNLSHGFAFPVLTEDIQTVLHFRDEK